MQRLAPVKTIFCPSCRQKMDILPLESRTGQPLEIDLCYHCHGIWFDGTESTQLSPQSVLRLFKELALHKDDPHSILSEKMRCPRCRGALVRGSDRTKSGPYVVYRCLANRDGRFSSFSSFMVEKGFVRHLNNTEITALANSVKVINCSSCGASVDLRKDHACPYCRSAFSLLDPDAVEKALARYKIQGQASVLAAQAETGVDSDSPAQKINRSMAAADVLIVQERIRLDNERRAQEEARRRGTTWGPIGVEDLVWGAGLREVLRRLFNLL